MDDILARALRIVDALTKGHPKEALGEAEELVLVLEDAMDAADKTMAQLRQEK
jgi:hypothetical protein